MISTEVRTLALSSGAIAYTLKRSTRRRRSLEVSIDPVAGLSVAAPANAPDQEIERFVRSRERWILKHLAEGRNGAREAPRREFITGETLGYLGAELSLEVVEADRPGLTTIERTGERLVVRTPPAPTDAQRRSAVVKAIERWYRARADAVFAKRVRVFAPRAGVQPKRILVRAQKTRWGSCGKDGTLRLNWGLLMAPLAIVDYIVAHELCHLRWPGHGRRFWRLVENVLPDYETPRAQLRRDGWRYRLG